MIYKQCSVIAESSKIISFAIFLSVIFEGIYPTFRMNHEIRKYVTFLQIIPCKYINEIYDLRHVREQEQT